MNRTRAIKIVLLLSACFNILWIGYVFEICYGYFKDSMLSIKYGVPKSVVRSGWRLPYQNDPWTVYKSANGYGSRFCLDYGDGHLMFYVTALDDSTTASVTETKMVLAAPRYLLSWRHDTNGVCQDVMLKYNGRTLNCQDEGWVNSMKAVQGTNVARTNLHYRMRNAIRAKGESNSDAAPCIPDEDAQRLSSRIPSGMSSSERAKMASDTNSVKGKSEYGF